MSASVCTETLCHLGNQLCKRRPVSGSQDHWHVIWPALRRIELRIGRKRSVHFKDRVKLRRGGIGFHDEKLFGLLPASTGACVIRTFTCRRPTKFTFLPLVPQQKEEETWIYSIVLQATTPGTRGVCWNTRVL